MKKILICILVLILSLGSIFFFFKKNNKKLKVIETNFELPLINNISIRDNVLLVNAGNYVYGDVNQDGYINNLDILAINLMINDDLKYSESQKRLGDLNQDDKINSKDIDILNNYLDDKREYKYDYDKDLVIMGSKNGHSIQIVNGKKVNILMI